MKRPSGKANIASGKSSSGVGNLVGSTKTYLNGELRAKRIIIKTKDIELKTEIHYLNPRNQDALTLDAVSDILPSIRENGVTTEGVATEKDGKYYVLDASRRRFACIVSQQDLPLWLIEGEPTDTQLLKIINDSQEEKWSYPEHGQYLLKIAKKQNINIESMKIDELAKILGIGRESLRKRLEALDVNTELRTVFVDYEGIPNVYYADLAKLQRQLNKMKLNIPEQIGIFKLKLESLSLTGTVSERQKKTLEALKQFIGDITKTPNADPKWIEKELGSFDNKRTNVKRKVNESTRKIVYEFTRLPKDLQAKIDSLIEANLP